MDSLIARRDAKAALASLGVAVRFRGEVLPLEASHIMIDVVLEDPYITFEPVESTNLITLQIGFWARLPFSNAAELFDDANPLLAASGFYRSEGTRSLVEENWVGVLADYNYIIGD